MKNDKTKILDEIQKEKLKDKISDFNKIPTPKNYGWICPVCGCGNSPFANSCNRCVSKQNYESKNNM